MNSWPKPLQPGDTLYVITPSGRITDFTALKAGMKIWQDRGYNLELAEGYDGQYGYFSGGEEACFHQLHEGLLSDRYKGILIARGGYGSARLLKNPQLWQDVKPKWLIGFSDVTSLLWSGAAHSFIGGIHGPVLVTLAQEPEWSINRLFSYLEGKDDLEPLQGTVWQPGTALGQLLPANLTTATHLIGTPHFPKFDNIILALEDIDEQPYAMDRQLTQWQLSGAFNNVKGIVLGRFSNCVTSRTGTAGFMVEEVLKDKLLQLGIPVLAGLPFGHSGENAALPVRCFVKIHNSQLIFNSN